MSTNNQHDSAWRRWLLDLRGLIASWWRVDRIRVSREESRWLELKPNDRIMLDGKYLTIRDRQVLRRDDKLTVVLDCEAESGRRRCEVRIGNDGRTPEVQFD